MKVEGVDMRTIISFQLFLLIQNIVGILGRNQIIQKPIPLHSICKIAKCMFRGKTATTERTKAQLAHVISAKQIHQITLFDAFHTISI